MARLPSKNRMKFSEIANNHFRPFATRYPNQIGTNMMVSYLKRSQASDDRPECPDTKMIFKQRKFRILKTLINMKFYLAIAFALLMATAYGIRIKQDADTCSADNTTVDTTKSANAITATTPSDTNICQDDSYVSENEGVECKYINIWCEDTTAGTTGSIGGDDCTGEFIYENKCGNKNDVVEYLWWSSDCIYNTTIGNETTICTSDYLDDFSQGLYSSYRNDGCTYEDGSYTNTHSSNDDAGGYVNNYCYGDGTVDYCTNCDGGIDETGNWYEDCKETVGDKENSPEAALNESIAEAESVANMCGCQEDSITAVGKLSNSLDLVICTFL
jgi:hypothetical protein